MFKILILILIFNLNLYLDESTLVLFEHQFTRSSVIIAVDILTTLKQISDIDKGYTFFFYLFLEKGKSKPKGMNQVL